MSLEAVHREFHGLIPNEIVSVAEDEVLSFLGGIYDPEIRSGSTPTRMTWKGVCP